VNMQPGGPPPVRLHSLLRRRKLCNLTFQPCPGIVEVALRFTVPAGQQAVNVFHVGNNTGDPTSLSDLSTIAEGFATWFDTGNGAGDTYRGRVSSAATLDSVFARDLTVAAGFEATHAVGHAGQDVSAFLGNGNTVALSARSPFAGRSFRGRTFVVGLCADSLVAGDANRVNAAYVTNQLNAFNALIPAVAGFDTLVPMSLQVLSRFNKDSVPAPPHKRANGVGTDVVDFTVVDVFVDFQRRRAPGHNRHH